MTFKEYQEEANQLDPSINMSILDKEGNNTNTVNYIYPALSLTGEAGEVSEKIKKLIRDKGGVPSKEDTNNIIKELGDVLWNIAVLSSLFGASLEEVAQLNIDKLKSRKDRNTLNGSGDDR